MKILLFWFACTVIKFIEQRVAMAEHDEFCVKVEGLEIVTSWTIDKRWAKPIQILQKMRYNSADTTECVSYLKYIPKVS